MAASKSDGEHLYRWNYFGREEEKRVHDGRINKVD